MTAEVGLGYLHAEAFLDLSILWSGILRSFGGSNLRNCASYLLDHCRTL